MLLKIIQSFKQGRSQEFAMWDKRKRGSWGWNSPSGVQGQSPGEDWGRSPRNRRQMLISSYDGGTCTYVPLGYATAFRSKHKRRHFSRNS